LCLLIIGQLRTAEACLQALAEKFVEFENCRVFVQCPAGALEEGRHVYRTKYIDAWDPSPLPVGLKVAWPLFGNSGRAAKKAKPSFYYQVARQARAAKVFAKQIDWQKDWILKWRPDLRLLGSFDWRDCLREQAIWIPFHDNHGGFNDQCALGPASLMRHYLTRSSMLPEYLGFGGPIHAETFLEWSLQSVPVRRVPIPYCIDRGSCLNPVKMSTELGDVMDRGLIDEMQSAGAKVELGFADSKSAKLDPLGRAWQRCVARTLLSAERLAS